MKAVCRADASTDMGAGHVMRCLTLAQCIRRNGGDVHFVTRDHPGHFAKIIHENGFSYDLLPVKSATALGDDVASDAVATQNIAQNFQADWVIVDHYGTDAVWETQQTVPVLAFEDVPNRTHDCAILLNQNLGADRAQFDHLIPARTCGLMGIEYALLREEFSQLRPAALARRATTDVKNILINMGGSDLPNATGWVLDALSSLTLPDDLEVTIVVGPASPWLDETRQKARDLAFTTTVLAGTNEMAQLMVNADMAIGAGGSTSWERCCLGLPCVSVIIADNQIPAMAGLAQSQAASVVTLGETDQTKDAIERLIFDRDFRTTQSHIGAGLVDGKGADRVFQKLQEIQG